MSWKDSFPKENRYLETKNGILYCGDCLEIMKNFPKESFDLVLTDPPYNTHFNEAGGLLAKMFNDSFSDEEYNHLLTSFSSLSYSLLKPNRPLFSFIDWRQYPLLVSILKKDFNFKQALIWDKIAHGLNYQNYAYTYEIIVFATKGKYFPKRKKIKKDVLRYMKINSYFLTKMEHPTVKPLSLICDLIEDNSDVQDLVLDPFVGTGTTAVACEILNRRWIAIEIDEKYCEIAKKRILEYANQNKLTNFFGGG